MLILFIIVTVYIRCRMGVPVDKMTHMVGSYAPKLEAHSYQTPLEDAPSGMLKKAGTLSKLTR